MNIQKFTLGKKFKKYEFAPLPVSCHYKMVIYVFNSVLNVSSAEYINVTASTIFS